MKNLVNISLIPSRPYNYNGNGTGVQTLWVTKCGIV